MMYPRIEIVKHRTCQGRQAERNYMRTGIAYAESFHVQTMRPNRTMMEKTCQSRSQATLIARQELEKLKREGYENVVYDGRLVKF